MGSTQQEQAQAFRAMHVPGDPVVLFNIWDAGSAKAVAEAGARALATGSWSVAAAHGYGDGEQLPLDLALANARRIAGATDLPLSLDLEGGYGATPGAVGETVRRAIEAGVAGVNIEDQLIGTDGLRSITEQAARLRTARAAADVSGVSVFLNARADVFIKGDRSKHGDAEADAWLERARAYADAGADGLFAPGLTDEALIGRLCEESPLPVNILTAPDGLSHARLASLGVARISYGPGPYRSAMRSLAEAAKAAYA